LFSEVARFRNFGSETIQGLSEFINPLLLYSDDLILLKQLLCRTFQLDALSFCNGTFYPRPHERKTSKSISQPFVALEMTTLWNPGAVWRSTATSQSEFSVSAKVREANLGRCLRVLMSVAVCRGG
jgi:hypothetical protein